MKRVAVVLALVACGCRDSTPTPAPSQSPSPPPAPNRDVVRSLDSDVTWHRIWTTDAVGDLIPAQAGVVLLRQGEGSTSLTIALDEKTGAERWRASGRIEPATSEEPIGSVALTERYYAIDYAADVIDVRAIDAGTGAVQRQASVPRANATTRAIIANDAILTVDGTRMQAFSLRDGAHRWTKPSPMDASKYAGWWGGRAVFVDPYMAIDLGTGETAWTMAGCCEVGSIGAGRAAAQLANEVAIIGADGSILTRHAGTIRSIVDSRAVIFDAKDKTYFLYGAEDHLVELTPFDPAPASPIAVSGQHLYYYTAAGNLRELNVDRHEVATSPYKVTGPAAAVAPLAYGDHRIYLPAGGWTALERWPSRSGRNFDFH